MCWTCVFSHFFPKLKREGSWSRTLNAYKKGKKNPRMLILQVENWTTKSEFMECRLFRLPVILLTFQAIGDVVWSFIWDWWDKFWEDFLVVFVVCFACFFCLFAFFPWVASFVSATAVTNGLGVERWTFCSEIFVDWYTYCQFLFGMTVNYPFTHSLKNDTFGTLEVLPPYYLTFTLIVLKKKQNSFIKHFL